MRYRMYVFLLLNMVSAFKMVGFATIRYEWQGMNHIGNGNINGRQYVYE